MDHIIAMRFLPSVLLVASLPLFAACSTSTEPAAAGAGGADGEELGETYDPATGRPNYTRRNTTLLGDWAGSDDCAGGFDMCTDARIEKKADGSWAITLGPSEYGSNLTLPLTPSKGVFVFTSGDGYGVSGHDDCQDPGCGDLMKVNGVLYAKKVGQDWVPTLKVSFDFEFNHPDEEDAPSGEVEHTSYMTKRR